MDEAGLRVEERWRDDVMVLGVSGDVDALTARELSHAIDVAAAKSPTTVIVDLSGVDLLESSGMSALIGARAELGPDVRFGVVANGAVHRVLARVGIPLLIAVSPTFEEALTASAAD